MKRKLAFIALLLALSALAFAKITKHEETVRTTTPGLECKKIVTDTNYKKNGSGDWLKPNHLFVFRSTKKVSADVKADKSASTFNNCKLVYSSVFVSKDGEWTDSGLLIEAIDGEKPWNYNLSWNVAWRK